MDNLRSWLECLNRKERYWLLSWAVASNGFSLSPGFGEALGNQFDLDIPADAFCAMDYHLDWIHASLHLAKLGIQSAPFVNRDHSQPGPVEDNRSTAPAIWRDISANQEDIDFLVAFPMTDQWHLILVEAKADSGFTNKQMVHKAKRLRLLFGEAGDQWSGVVPHFALTSPRLPAHLTYDKWPDWMVRRFQDLRRPVHLVLPFPNSLRRVTRCNEKSYPDINGSYWTVVGGDVSSPDADELHGAADSAL